MIDRSLEPVRVIPRIVAAIFTTCLLITMSILSFWPFFIMSLFLFTSFKPKHLFPFGSNSQNSFKIFFISLYLFIILITIVFSRVHMISCSLIPIWIKTWIVRSKFTTCLLILILFISNMNLLNHRILPIIVTSFYFFVRFRIPLELFFFVII